MPRQVWSVLTFALGCPEGPGNSMWCLYVDIAASVKHVPVAVQSTWVCHVVLGGLSAPPNEAAHALQGTRP